MSITDREIQHLAELARIILSEEETRRMREELNDILALAESIQEVDTEGIEPTYHVWPLENVFRDDRPGDSTDPDEVLSGAPEASDGYFVVPRVIEDG